MRKVAKGTPPTDVAPDGHEPCSWIQAQHGLREELTGGPPQPAQVARARFDGLDKAKIRRQLASEQQHLCVFCEARIDPKSSSLRIAHWRPIAHDPAGALDWHNVYASCAGLPVGQSCDAAQGAADPKLEPPHARDWSQFLDFEADGSLSIKAGAPAALQPAVMDLWRLDSLTMRAARKAAVQAEHELLERRYPDGCPEEMAGGAAPQALRAA